MDMEKKILEEDIRVSLRAMIRRQDIYINEIYWKYETAKELKEICKNATELNESSPFFQSYIGVEIGRIISRIEYYKKELEEILKELKPIDYTIIKFLDYEDVDEFRHRKHLVKNVNRSIEECNNLLEELKNN